MFPMLVIQTCLSNTSYNLHKDAHIELTRLVTIQSFQFKIILTKTYLFEEQNSLKFSMKKSKNMQSITLYH